jgi:hypothetical protein
LAWNPWDSPEGQARGLNNDPLLDWIAEDPTEIPDYFVIIGLVGKAPEEKVWRIYLNYALSEYYEIAEEHIVYAQTTDDERTRVWVRSGSPMSHVLRRPTRAERIAYVPGRGQRRTTLPNESYYLSGPIAEGADWGDGEPDPFGEPQLTGCAACPGTR